MPRSAPPSWLWSHDIEADQIGTLAVPGLRLQRLASYRAGAVRRFAALMFAEPGPPRTWEVDLPLAAATAPARAEHAVAITADVPPGASAAVFTLVLDAEPTAGRAVHADLDAAGVAALLDGDHAIVDFATYELAGARRFAAIVEPRVTAAAFFADLAPEEVDARLRGLDAMPARMRELPGTGGAEGGVRVAILAERAVGTRWTRHVGLDGDAIARELETHRAFPYDLDAWRDASGVRFAVVAVREDFPN